ncbi:hypothetical protein [Methyloceanibacter stevinii]|nr:hypothetical protein [Methyloceanibacter stevinii]
MLIDLPIVTREDMDKDVAVESASEPETSRKSAEEEEVTHGV